MRERRFPATPPERHRRLGAAIACPAGARERLAHRPIARVRRVAASTIGGFTALLLVFLIAVPMFTASRPAYAVDLACQVTGDYTNIGPDTPGGGVEGLLPRVSLWDSNPNYIVDGNLPGKETATPAKNYTLWELNGTGGLDWSTSGKDVSNNDACSVWNVTLSQVAQIIFEVPRFVVSVTNSLQEMATANKPVTPLLDRLDGTDHQGTGVVTRLFVYITVPGVVIALIATGLWILTRTGQRRRQGAGNEREIVDGAIWAVGATAVVLFLLLGNAWRTYLNAGDQTVGAFNSAINSALLPDIGSSGPCALPDSAPNRGQRVAICNFYKAFGFEPWARGQFGSAGGGQLVAHCVGNTDLSESSISNDYKSYLGDGKSDARMFEVEAQSYNLNDWKRVQAGDEKAQKQPPGGGKYSAWGDLRSHMQGGTNCKGPFTQYTARYNNADKHLAAYYPDWSGGNGFSRVGIAMSDALLATLCAIVPLFTAMLAFMFEILAWLTIFALPIAGVAGIFPPLRSWLTSLLSTLVASYIARFAFGVLLTMTELAYSMVFSSPFPFGVQILILLVIVFTAIHLIRSVREASLTSTWGRAMHRGTVTMAGTAGQRAGAAATLGRTVVAGAATGLVSAAVEERAALRTRRNTPDRPMGGREAQPGQPAAPRRPAAGPAVAPTLTTGSVVRADGATSTYANGTAGGDSGPSVAGRIRRDRDAATPPPAPANPPAAQEPARRQGQPVTSDRTPAVVGGRGTNGTAPRSEPEPVVTDAPPPDRRPSRSRSRWVDPEL